ncbi:MAG TPA: polyprenyl diphosphate synthase [Candidatus Eisenbacteria bacterium]|nr:polyprenyl diphosphate synthase [Candidatus Eisenbacteria bacterium]
MSHPTSPERGLHVAIIMDGNGRWAERRGWPRNAGHVAGAEAVRRTVTAARKRGIAVLTLYAFSSDNWQRPRAEVSALMRLFKDALAREVETCLANGIRLTVIGRRDRLAVSLVQAIERAEAATARNTAMHLRLAVDYSARDALVAAAAAPNAGEAAGDPSGEGARMAFERRMAEWLHDPLGCPGVDLLIRTGGERRLSDFLLWECAYAELVFMERMWPDFGDAELEQALTEFAQRERRFGRVPKALPQQATGTSGS